MAPASFARVVFESPLPALNREFEYRIPDHLKDQLALGILVEVPFAHQSKQGYVVGLSDQQEWPGELATLSKICSAIPILQNHVYKLLVEISQRQCCALGEVLKVALPKRIARAEKNYIAVKERKSTRALGIRTHKLSRPHALPGNGLPDGLLEFARLAKSEFDSGASVIVCLPDFRDVANFESLLAPLVDTKSMLRHDTQLANGERYLQFLRQTVEPLIVYGTRSVLYSPLPESSSVLVWEDGDQSHIDQQTPYLSSREIALIRQDTFGCNLHFRGHSISTEIQRLCEIGYLSVLDSDSWRPNVAVSQGSGLDGLAFRAIKDGLQTGPVLVQVAAPGMSRSLFCNECSERSHCFTCNGPLWTNQSNQIVCRWCSNLNLHFTCKKCGSTKLRNGAAGSTRWVSQLGVSFPGVTVREIQATDEYQTINSTPQIVVATPGVEPPAIGGYSSMVFLDGSAALNRDSLRASEDALRNWLNALAFMNQSGRAVIVGSVEEVKEAFTLGEVREIAARILAEREELGFPPAVRLFSATGDLKPLENLRAEISKIDGVRVLGISKARQSVAEGDYRLVATFKYSAGRALSNAIKENLNQANKSSKRLSTKTGKPLRPVTIKFDDPKVL